MPKVLLVEDNEDNRDMLARRLQRRGCEVIFASNGAEAVSKTLGEKPDLVLMDMNLPVMDGWEATRQIKANPKTQTIPVMALTANTTSEDRERAFSAGCDDYETKPVDLPRLLEKIDKLIEKSAAQKLETRSLSLPQDSRIQRALLSHLRHELCTPMNAIIGYSEILLDELKSQPDSDVANDLQKIYNCGIQLLTLANAILDPTRPETSQLDRNLDSFSSMVRLELLTPLSTVIGYCEMLLEEVSDPLSSDLEKIHTAAQRLLSMVNDIVSLAEQQLQAIDVEQLDAADLILSTPTATSLFQSAATTIRSLSETNPWEQVVQGGTLLVVDDNETNCDLLSRQLERQGYTVTMATSGQQALSLLTAKPYDLILLDIIMPRMSGFEVLEKLKSDQEWRQIPVIMISALDEIDSVIRCIEMGAEDYLSKPFKPVLLRAKIRACLEKKRLREQQVLLLAQRLIAEATPFPVLISRIKDGALLYANTKASSTFGLSIKELLSHHLQDFYFNPAEHQELMEVLSRDEFIQQRELHCKRAEGTSFWVTASLQALTFNGEAAALSALCDITDRKQAEEALRLAEEKYRSIFENAVEGIFQATPDGRLVSVNPAMAKIHGYESPIAMMEAVTANNYPVYVDTNTRGDLERLLKEQGEVKSFEYEIYRLDGKMIWICESVSAVRDANGQLLYYEGIVKDVTQRKLQEAALMRQLEELQIEIDQRQRARQVAEIVETDYFQQLKAEAANLRFDDFEDDEPVSEPVREPVSKPVSEPIGEPVNKPVSEPIGEPVSRPVSEPVREPVSKPVSEPVRAVPRVLLVEDNEDNRDMLSRRLRRSGYEVVIAVDGAEGVSMTATEKPDIVLMDMSLPVMDGWQATQQLKANPQTRSIPVIALTAHAMSGDREKALRAGCDEYDTKPIDLARLLGKIKALLEKVKS